MGNEVITNNHTTKIIAKTFLWMFMGILATAIISWYTYSTGMAVAFATNGTYLVLMLVELIVVLLCSLFFHKLPPLVVSILYFVYAVLNGVTMSTIFAIFELNSIVIIFGASALLFGLFAVLGFFTKRDISKISTLLFGTLIIGIIVSFINLFLGNTMLDLILSWVMLFVFFGITAYDMQHLKALANTANADDQKVYIYGAMQLYLDFINIFLRVLNIFGSRK